MKALVLKAIAEVARDSAPLAAVDLPVPEPKAGEVLVKVSACGVCHTELDEIEGRMPPPRLPVVPGHQVVGRVAALGPGGSAWREGDRIGVAWIYSACGTCRYCVAGDENLCADFKATGRDADGGYAEYLIARGDYAHAIPEAFSDAEAAPLLCAGAIGYRALRLADLRDGGILGLAGFGASAHLVLMMARRRHPGSPVFVFARSEREREFARELGAAWAGGTDDEPPAPCAAIIDTTPAWRPVIAALARLEPGGRLVVNAIRKEEADKPELLSLDYASHLWMEKKIASVANVARRDVREFLDLAAAIPLRPRIEEYALAEANRALVDLKMKSIRGAKVLRVS